MIRKSFLSAVILVTAFCFTACGKPQTTNEIVTTSTTDTQVQTTPDALSTTEVEVTEQEVAEPEVVEAEPEKETISLDDWTAEIIKNNADEDLVFSIYNENTKTGTMLDTEKENGELCVIIKGEYTLEDGDILVICFNEDILVGHVNYNGISLKAGGKKYHTYTLETGEVSCGLYYKDIEYKVNLTIN